LWRWKFVAREKRYKSSKDRIGRFAGDLLIYDRNHKRSEVILLFGQLKIIRVF